MDDITNARNKLAIEDEIRTLINHLKDTDYIYQAYLEETLIGQTHKRTDTEILQILNDRQIKRMRLREIESLY